MMEQSWQIRKVFSRNENEPDEIRMRQRKREVGMEEQKGFNRLRNAGFGAFFISGICAISCGVVVSLLQEQLGFDYKTTGTLLSMMNMGNLAAGFAAAFLAGKLGMKSSALILGAGYLAGYLWMSGTSLLWALMAAFFLVGVGKGAVMNTCTILVGNHSEDRTRGMNMMHSCYAAGALLCPFIISAAAMVWEKLPMVVLGILGGAAWLIFALAPMNEEKGKAEKGKTQWNFLGSRRFWLLTALLFCQNGAETSVTGWLVTYFKGSGILTGALSAYTVTVMWMATMAARLLFAFVFPIKNKEKAMIRMALCCIIFYFGLMQAESQWPAILLLFAFAASMAGMNPTAVACAGKMTSVASMGVMLPVASSGSILMPWIIGIVSENFGIRAGMFCNIIPCAGLFVFSILTKIEQRADKE